MYLRRSLPSTLVLALSISFLAGFFCANPVQLSAASQPTCTGPTTVNPVLFVHGIMGDASDWAGGGSGGIRGSVADQLALDGYTNTQDYDLYFDGTNVRWSNSASTTTDQDPIAAPGTIPCDARIFSVRFFGWTNTQSVADNFDPLNVVKVSVITKSHELSQVIKAITAATYVQEVILVAHSMGALDSRIYMENLSSAENSACSSAVCPVSSYPDPYMNDVALLVTVDGANSGSRIADLLQPVADLLVGATNVNELEADSSIIQAVNYRAPYLDASNVAVIATDPPGNVVAIVDEFDALHFLCVNSLSFGCGTDDAVVSDSQSIVSSLGNHATSADVDMPQGLPYNTFRNDISISGDPLCSFSIKGVPIDNQMLHLLPCLADKHDSEFAPADLVFTSILPFITGQYSQINIRTYDSTGAPFTGAISLKLAGPVGTSRPKLGPTTTLTGSQVPVSSTNPYNLVYVSGGPTGAGTPTITAIDASNTATFSSLGPCNICYIKPGNWSLTFNVNFPAATASKPTVSTQPATNLAGDGATLVASVNPNNAPTTAWFEWGSTSALGNTTPKQFVPAGAAAVAVTAQIGGLASNGQYYFRADAQNSQGSSQGQIVPFSTLSTLPAPNLLAPQSGATNVSTTPTFSWSGVQYATSYRILVAKSASALPSAPNSAACGAGCVIDEAVAGTSFTPQAGVLNPGTQYSWQVHARSPSQYGSWSTVSSFTAGLPSVSGVSVAPSLNPFTSGSPTTLTVTLNAPAPAGGSQVALSSTSPTAFPVPPTITVPAGSTSASAAVTVGTVSAASAAAGITVTATLNGKQTISINVAPASSKTTTLAATTVTSTSAILNGTINPQGAHGVAQFWYGTSLTQLNSTCSVNSSNCPLVTPSTAAQAFTYSLTGLSNATTYYFMTAFYNTDTGNVQLGAALSFITGQGPLVTTMPATNISSAGATLNATVNPLGANGQVYFDWGTDPTMGSYTTCNSSALAPNSTPQSFNCGIGNLSSATLYYFRAEALDRDSSQYFYGTLQSFTTASTPITTGAATAITSYSATLNGTINTGGATGLAYFEFGTDSSFGSYVQTSFPNLTASTSTQSVSLSTLTNCCNGGVLASGTTYYFRTVFDNRSNGEEKYGPVQKFSTPATPVTTGAATAITSYSAALNGTINTEGATGLAYFEFGTDSSFGSYVQTSFPNLTASTSAQSVSLSTLTNCCNQGVLASGTTYYFRTVFDNRSNGEEKYGPVQHFKTFQPNPTITWPAPAAITYGTALSATQLDATANVPGTFVYTPSKWTILKAGSYTLNVTFTPADTKDFNTATASVSLTVNQATPVITWPQPAAIVYGTPLTATQLDAKVNVPGSLVYNFPLNTVLPIGSQTLNASFTPTDSADYTAAQRSMQIAVLPIAAAPTFSPAAGTYASAQSVTIADSATRAVIYYTTNGSTPTTSSTKYTAPVRVSSSETLTAIAVAANYGQSPAASAAYTIGVPQVKLSATTVNFGSQAVNTVSALKTVTLTNSGNAPLLISGIDVAGVSESSFFVADSCGGTLAAGKSCIIYALFYPNAKGAASATINISDNATGSPQTISLTGTGN